MWVEKSGAWVAGRMFLPHWMGYFILYPYPPVKDLRLNKIAFNPEDFQKVLVYPLKNTSPPPEKYGSTPLREYGSTSEKYVSYPLKNNYGSTP